MPKPTAARLIWVRAQEHYEWQSAPDQRTVVLPAHPDSAAVLESHLAAHVSLAFQGRQGALTLLKESRARGGDYWYAYRRRGLRVVKKYLGRTAALSIAHLEQVARLLNTDAEAGQAPKSVALLAPKLAVPRQHGTPISRLALAGRLNQVLDHRLMLISAPAGFGKTTLVSQWAAQNLEAGPTGLTGPIGRLGWISLDEADNDPEQFWRYVIAACQSAHQPSQASSAPNTYKAELTALLNSLTDQARPVVLILDDFQVITSPHIHHMLATMIDQLPNALHLMLLSRSEPPLPLARWRARHELVEMSASDLRFTAEEAQTCLQQTLAANNGAEKVQADIRQFVERVEGWPVAVRLAAQGLQGRRDPAEIEQTLAKFSGSHQHIQAYLIEEVLNPQPEALQQFLLDTSLLDRLTAPLCDAITGRHDSAALLDELGRNQLFFTELDGTPKWYRHHTLFAEALRAEAERRLSPDTLRALYLKASHWYEANQMPVEAVESTLAAKAVDRAARLMVHYAGLYELMGHATLRRWLMQIPEAIVNEHAVLCMGQAICLLFTNNRYAPATRERVEPPLLRAEALWRADGNLAKVGEVLAVRSLMLFWQRQFDDSFTLNQQALELLPKQDQLWHGECLIRVGVAQIRDGQLNQARVTLNQARAACEAVGHIMPLLAATFILGDVCCWQGDLPMAQKLYERVLALATDRWGPLFHQGKRALDDKANALLGLAQVAAAQRDWVTAESNARQVLELSQSLNDPEVRVRATLLLAEAAQARNQPRHAHELIQQQLAQITQPSLRCQLLLNQTQVALSTNDIPAAQRALDLYAATDAERVNNHDKWHTLQQEQAAMLTAQLHIARGDSASALALLTRWLPEAEAMGRGQHADSMRELIAAAHALKPELANATPTLTPQEQRVLQLLAEGRTRPQIAAQLVTSINTVKTQLNHIYRKLNVDNRDHALERARQRRLI